MGEPIAWKNGNFARDAFVIEPFGAFVLVFPRIFVRLQASQKGRFVPN